MAAKIGLEPITYGLTDHCSAIELLGIVNMAGPKGLEPSTSCVTGTRSNQTEL